jgi:hypothetical protein
MSYIVTDSCHKYDMNLLDKHIKCFPVISIPKKLLNIQTDSDESTDCKSLKNLCKRIVVFDDFLPLSNWFSPLKNIYAKLLAQAKTNVSVVFINYAELKICTIGEESDLVMIKKSTISGAGKGLFATKAIPKGTEICIFIDTIHGHPTILHSQSYFVNHSEDLPNTNIKMVRKGGCVRSVLYSLRQIKKGEELFVNYISKIMLANYPEFGGITF